MGYFWREHPLFWTQKLRFWNCVSDFSGGRHIRKNSKTYPKSNFGWYGPPTYGDGSGGGTYSGPDFNNQMISLTTISLLSLVISPILPLMWVKSSFKVFEDRLMRLVKMDSLLGDNGRLFMGPWHFWYIHIAFVEETTFGWMYSLIFPFCLSLFSPILSHQSVLRYYISSEVDSRILIRVPSGGFILYQSHLLLMQCQRAYFLRLLNRFYCSFPRRFIPCSLE